jgi:hypothetical protein
MTSLAFFVYKVQTNKQTIAYFCRKLKTMRYPFFLFLLAFSACQTIKIKNNSYRVATTLPELGSVGKHKSAFNLKNAFETRTLPTLENKIRIAVEIVPFNKRLNKIYIAKSKFDQNQAKVAYVDSLDTKPEIVTIQLLDVLGFVNELNAANNKNVFKIIDDLENSKVVTGIAVSFSKEDIAKIRQSDSYYLSNNQEKKYTISLYKQGKKTENMELNPESIVAYKLGTFCWAEDNRNHWYIADIIGDNSSCNGKTSSKVKEKRKEESLFKM